MRRASAADDDRMTLLLLHKPLPDIMSLPVTEWDFFDPSF